MIGGSTGTSPGGPCMGACNLVSGNNGSGIDVTGGFAGNARVLVSGNFVGVDASGTAALGNALYGVQAGGGSSDTVIGGSSPAARNVISGNGSFYAGVHLGSGGGGGHTAPGQLHRNERKRHGGNRKRRLRHRHLRHARHGDRRRRGRSRQSRLRQHRRRHLHRSLRPATSCRAITSEPMPRAGADSQRGPRRRIIESSDDNTIGGPSPGEGNVIAFHPFDGVFVLQRCGQRDPRQLDLRQRRSRNRPRRATASRPNDAGDGDTGANDLQNFPVLTSVDVLGPQGSGTRFQGILHSAPSTTYDLDFYANPAVRELSARVRRGPDPTSGRAQVTTDGAGDRAFDVTLPVARPGRRASRRDGDGPRRQHLRVLAADRLLDHSPAGPAAGGTDIAHLGHRLRGRRGGHGRRRSPPPSVDVTDGHTAITATTPRSGRRDARTTSS